jgi:hypothetical protein
MNQFTCKGVKQINNRISLKIDIHLYHSYLSAFFVKAGVPNGEFPEILIAKCRSRIFGTWFFSQAEDFGSWREGRKGSSKSGEKCSRRKVHMYDVQGLKFSSPGLFVDDFLLARQIQVLAQAWRKLLCSPWKITFGLLVFCIFFGYCCFVMTVRSLQFPFVTCWFEKLCQTLPTHDQSTFNIFRCNSSVFIISRKPTNFAVYCSIFPAILFPTKIDGYFSRTSCTCFGIVFILVPYLIVCA